MRLIQNDRVEIIAEIGANAGSIEAGMRLVDDAARAGATAVKVQVYQPASLTLDGDGEEFVCKHAPWKGRKLWDIYAEGQTPRQVLVAIANQARKRNLGLVASVYCAGDIYPAMELEPDALKIASFELNDLFLIKEAAKVGVPLILSTGMASLVEVEAALEAAERAPAVAIMHCVSAYPTPAHSANLPRIERLKRLAALVRGAVGVGYSDHTTSTVVPALAVAYGISMIEKHIRPEMMMTTADHAWQGYLLDRDFSLGPTDFAEMVRNIREAEAATQSPSAPVAEMTDLRRSLYVVRDVEAGEVLTGENVRSIRPANGLPPAMRDAVYGKRAVRDMKRGHALAKGDFQDGRSEADADDPA